MLGTEMIEMEVKLRVIGMDNGEIVGTYAEDTIRMSVVSEKDFDKLMALLAKGKEVGGLMIDDIKRDNEFL